MAKLFSIILVVAFVAICTAEPARLRQFRQSRFSARQVVAEDVPAQTPYPPAGEKPDIPFDLPSEEPQEPVESAESLVPEEPQQPDNTYLPPDNLLPPAEAYGPPDQFYGPPEASGDGEVLVDNATVNEEEPADEDSQNELVAVNPEAEEIENPQSERFVLAKGLRKQSVRPAKLRSEKLRAIPAARLRSQRLVAQPIYSTSGALVAYKVLRV